MSDYEQGRRMAWTQILGEAIRELYPALSGQEALQARLLYEREQAVSMLRQVCDEFGDNDWTPDLHLADVIEKHLWRHLGNR